LKVVPSPLTIRQIVLAEGTLFLFPDRTIAVKEDGLLVSLDSGYAARYDDFAPLFACNTQLSPFGRWRNLAFG
jgi:hypothetical protein